MRAKSACSVVWKNRIVLLYITMVATTFLTLSKIVWLNTIMDKPYYVTYNKGFDNTYDKRREVQVMTDRWTQVEGLNETHVFNAFYTGRDEQVRVLGVAPTNLLANIQCTYRCLVDHIAITVNGSLVQMLDHHGLSELLLLGSLLWFLRKYQATDPGEGSDLDIVHPIFPSFQDTTFFRFRHNNIEILCEAPTVCRPAAVSVAATGTRSNIYIRIHYPPYPPVPTHLFTVCYPVIHSNYSVFTELVQSVELDSLLGGEKFNLYYESASPEVDAVLRMYVDSGVLEVIPWAVPKVDVHYHAQITAIRDCFYRNMHTSKYLVFKDFDEVLLPFKHRDWKGLLEDHTKRDSKYAAFIFRNSFLFKGDPDVSEGFSAYLFKRAETFGLTALLKQHRQVKIWPNKWRSKFIVMPEGVENVEIHMVKALRKGYKSVVFNESDALMFHYKRFVDRKIERRRDSSMLRFKGSLIEKVDNVYFKLNQNYSISKPMFP